jgi:hypothetical protein
LPPGYRLGFASAIALRVIVDAGRYAPMLSSPGEWPVPMMPYAF